MLRSFTIALLLATVVLFDAIPSLAAGLSDNIRLLQTSDDFRVRTQAALALGTTATKRAVVPLCGALDDSNRTVRIAAATALSRLKKGGEACLQNRQRSEEDSKVRAAIDKALAGLSGSGGEPEPTIGRSTAYLIAVDKLTGPARLQGAIRSAFVRVGQKDSKVAFAPEGQTPAEASRVLGEFKQAQGFLISPQLSRPQYEGGVLSLKMSITIVSYPGGNLLGSYSKTVGMQGITSKDTESENELVVIVAEESMKQFMKLIPSLSR